MGKRKIYLEELEKDGVYKEKSLKYQL